MTTFSSPTSTPFDLPESRPALEEQVWVLLEMAQADQVFVYFSRETTGIFDPAIAFGALSLPEKQSFWANQLDPATDVLAAELIRDPHPIEVVDEECRRKFAASFLNHLRGGSYLIFPLNNRTKLLGMIVFGWNQTGVRLEPQQMKLARAVVRSMAIALENAHLVEMISQQLHQTLSLQEITQAILRKVDLNEVLQMVAHQAVRLTDALGSSIRLCDEQGRWQTAYQTGRIQFSPLDLAVQGDLEPADLLKRSEPLLINLRREQAKDSESDAVLIVPLLADETVIGMLEIFQRRTYVSQADIQVAKSFANQAVIAIEHARLYERVQHTAVVEERARLARDLHDSISQSLYALSLQARAAQRHIHSGRYEAAQNALQEIGITSRGALGEMRLLIFELRPPMLEQLGLVGAIEHRLKSVEERSGFTVDWSAELHEELPRSLEEGLYRIVQEALNNIIKHASAARVQIRLKAESEQIRLEIADNGKGFESQQMQNGGIGIRNMQERTENLGGRFQITSLPGEGTHILVEVPYAKNTHSGGG